MISEGILAASSQSHVLYKLEKAFLPVWLPNKDANGLLMLFCLSRLPLRASSFLAGLCLRCAELPWICIYVIPWCQAEHVDVPAEGYRCLRVQAFLCSCCVLFLFPCWFDNLLLLWEQLELNLCSPLLGHF